MSVVRVNKTKNFTTMSNYHLKDKNLSLKAKGLLSVMLSLDDEWKYSVDGLCSISKENKTAINSTLKELKDSNYLVVSKDRKANGTFEYVYDIYEQPQTDKPDTDKPDMENPAMDNPYMENLPLNKYINNINTNNKYTNNKNKNKNNIKPQRHKYGEYGRILLTDEQYQKLCEEYDKEFIDEIITRVDEYIESNNNKNGYKDFNLVVRKAIREKWFKMDYATYNNYKKDDSITIEEL